MNRRQRLWQELKALGLPVILYDVSVLVSLGLFAMAIVIDGPSGATSKVMLLGSVTLGTLTGLAVGQFLSVTRLRSTLFHLLDFLAFVGIVYVGTWIGPMMGEVGAVVFVTAMIGAIVANGAFLSLRTNRSMVAVWAPMMLATVSILIITEASGDDRAWHQGDKFAIWNGLTIGILVLTITLQLAFLAAREQHRVHRWRTAPVATEVLGHRRDPIRPLRGCGTVALLAFLVGFLTFSSAVVAPYLWRTAPPDEDGVIETQGFDEGEQEAEKDDGGGFGGLPQVQEAVKQGVQATCALLTLVVLGILGLFVFGLPLRRQVLLTHLRNPMWPVPPSRRAHLHWRLAEIALGDAGIHRSPHETALDVAKRGVAAFPDLHLEALETAGQIADRVAYGYALEPSDPDMLGRAAEMTYQAVWESLSEWERIKATYRML